MTELMTIKECLDAVKEAKFIMVEARFGCSEYSVKISKLEARTFLGSFEKDQTPESIEMPCGYFGTFEGGILRLG